MATFSVVAMRSRPTSPALRRNRLWRRLAIVLGVVATLCSLSYGFLPVAQDTARIIWPVGGNTPQVNAPLTAYWAQHMRAAVPCETVRSVDARNAERALLLSTVPGQRAGDGAGMQLRIDNGLLVVSNRGEQIARQPLPSAGCDINVVSDATHTTVSVAGTPIYQQQADVRPRIIGIYSAIDAGSDPIDGLSVSITPDTRYQSSPTGWKVWIGVLAVLALIGCLFAVYRTDTGIARRAPRWAPVGWWRLSSRDVTVFGVLGAWLFIGPVTSDDGYILTMARVTEQAGYLTNYHRWFGVAEAPFGWFYHLFQLMTHVSTAPVWMRLPSLLLGIISWLLISREVMPRLGKEVRTSKAAGWAAAAVFLVWWMPYNNGLRPEPIAAVGSLLALCAVERALVTRRLLPLCLGLLAAALTLAATPTGLIAVAPYLVAARPLSQLLRQRAARGWLAVLAPIAASGFLVLIVVFADQTFASVIEATRLRAQVGPSMSWFEELSRYELLFTPTADGSATRRFPVLLLILCTATCLVVLLRRGRVPGASLGPSRRLIGTVALFFVLLALTPTKWTHHFGAFAAVGAAMAALTALATSSSVLRSRRNRAAFLSGLLVVAALAATGPNAYWFVSKFGVPFFDKPIELGGIPLSTILLIGAGIAAIVAFVENVRAHRPRLPPAVPEGRGRALRLGSMSLVVICGLVAAGEFGSMAWAIYAQRGGYSLGAANFQHVFGSTCNLADHVMVEQDPAASTLSPLPAAAQVTVEKVDSKQRDKAGQQNPLPDPDEASSTAEAFHTRPLGPDDPLDKPPHGFTSGAVPMWSSYDKQRTPTGELRTDWFGMPARENAKQLVVAVSAYPGKATSAKLQFGTQTDKGIKPLLTRPILTPRSGSGTWNDVRIDLDSVPPLATSVRIIANDDAFTDNGWVAFTAPRVPTFVTLTEKIGDKPVYIDWPASFVYPCIEPMKIRNGIAEVPAYHITAGTLANEASWAGASGGGPKGILRELAEQTEVPSFLRGEAGQSWGKLQAVQPYAEDAVPPTVITGREVHFGWWSPGPGPSPGPGRLTG